MDLNTARRSALLRIKDDGAAPDGTAAVGNYYEKHAAKKDTKANSSVSHTAHAPITIVPGPGHDHNKIVEAVVKKLDQRDKSASLRSSMIDWHTG